MMSRIFKETSTCSFKKMLANTGKICSALLLLSVLLAPGSTHDQSEPEFDVLLPNLTIKMGSDAAFTCIVKHLGEYRVAWIRSEDKAIIALHNHMVTHNHRFSVTHNGHNTWTLHIKNVQQNDSGSYMCQINTDPQRSQFGTLDVVVPADIIDAETSNDVVVSEGQSATLKCKATGYPQPKVRWRRKDGHPLPLSRDLANPSEKIETWEGETLPMRQLLRTDTGSYLCVANNSVPPMVSKRVMVFVHFHPLIKVSNQLVAAPAGINVTLECYVEAVPRPVVSWFNKDQLILNQVGKVWQETEPLKEYSMKMKLTIANLRPSDFMEYNCTAGNSLGSDSALIKLQQLHPPPTLRPTTTTASPTDWKSVKYGKERDSNGNIIKHSKDKRKQVRNKDHAHNNREFENEGEEIFLGEGLTTSSSLSSISTSGSGGLSKRNQKESPNRRLDNFPSNGVGAISHPLYTFPAQASTSLEGQGSIIIIVKLFHKCCLPLSLIPSIHIFSFILLSVVSFNHFPF